MQPKTYKLFAQLCESLVFEVSSTMNLINTNTGGTELVKYLHKHGLSHNQEYQPTARIAWSELKNYSRGGWVILQYPQGSGAIIQKGSSYTAVASTGAGEPETFKNDRGGNVLDFLKQRLGGNPRAMYVGRDTGAVKNLQQKRDELKTKISPSSRASADTLVIKFKPLWVRATTAAIADIKGMVTSMIKNDAFEKAKKKIDWLIKLVAALDEFESNPNSVPQPFHDAARKAVFMAAVHYYPDETGELTRSYNGHQVQDEKGVNHLLQDISNGDTTRVGTVLAFFKRNLLSR
jgi:hypothetical protein